MFDLQQFIGDCRAALARADARGRAVREASAWRRAVSEYPGGGAEGDLGVVGDEPAALDQRRAKVASRSLRYHLADLGMHLDIDHSLTR